MTFLELAENETPIAHYKLHLRQQMFDRSENMFLISQRCLLFGITRVANRLVSTHQQFNVSYLIDKIIFI